ncbi:hypothetical protein J6590_076968, partial [Homalodisca vitripennis]
GSDDSLRQNLNPRAMPCTRIKAAKLTLHLIMSVEVTQKSLLLPRVELRKHNALARKPYEMLPKANIHRRLVVQCGPDTLT